MHTISVENGSVLLDGAYFLAKGLRCSNGLYSDAAADDLVSQLGVYTAHGLNCISVFIMGNRFGNVMGYHPDGTLNHTYTQRLERIIEAADRLKMMVIVGCLYWGESEAKYDSWTQKEAERAVYETALWLRTKGYTNVIIDVDNEGMALAQKGFDNRALVVSAKSAYPSCPVATNFIGLPPEEADLGLHFSDKAPGKPYIESEGVPENAPGGYWVKYSRFEDPGNTYRRADVLNYNHIGIYTDEMKTDQINRTMAHLERGYGYMLASTWLQAVPPFGPNHTLGGYGTETDPGIRWWAEFILNRYGPYSK
ncbi:hypothetical protein [Breznakiella homolactica]|uniref:Uncharacterized protein n=1 Tax=Breznakiella homolactica TaxID=2798577 RepID=A0A7T7XKZ1_9SPIR|nr:hypothetical protein [Breznakiella homolactica]QQO08122.1 hypothetical protein JFL75_14390 [Breznakiella homolactica]